MAAKRIKRVIIAGAGFSAPANLPIQNRIIDKMSEEPVVDFLSGNIPQESIKFLNAYIKVGLFLLDNYGKGNYRNLGSKYTKLCQAESAMDILFNAKDKIAENDTFNKSLSEVLRRLLLEDDSYYASIFVLQNEIRNAIRREGITANLEDIFTSFDKSVISQEHLHIYTYTQMDELRYSIMRLFIYYFSKSVQDHSYKLEDYLNIIQYLKKRRTIAPTTIITTNWDTLIEEYFKRYGIKFSYGFHSPYTSVQNTYQTDGSDILLLKIHGSANWLKCLHCGAISVFDKNEAVESLLEDGKQERCALCGQGESFTAPSLQPEIITPTMLKSFTSRIYSNLWGAASSEIRSATEIIFIGYSFPIADYDFRYMLQKNVSPDAQIDVVLYNDDDPSQTDRENLRALLPEKRYRDAFPKNDIAFYYRGFKEYFAFV